MSFQFQQKLSEPLPPRLLHVWNMGLENLVMLGSEMGGLPSLTTHPSLQQQWPSAPHTSGNQALLDWLTAAIRAIWPNQGDIPYLNTSWETYVELQQVLRELDMKNIIYNMDPQGPSAELFTVGMRNLVLHTAPPILFVSLVTILPPTTGQPRK